MAGIYCAKKHNASVTCVDIDDAVLPYLNLIARTNNVEVDFLNLGFDQIRRNILNPVDIIIGSDICFCDSLIAPLRRLIQRAKQASVKQVIICDPGRWPFDDLSRLFVGKNGVELLEWEINKPYRISGKILKIQF